MKIGARDNEARSSRLGSVPSRGRRERRLARLARRRVLAAVRVVEPRREDALDCRRARVHEKVDELMIFL